MLTAVNWVQNLKRLLIFIYLFHEFKNLNTSAFLLCKEREFKGEKKWDTHWLCCLFDFIQGHTAEVLFLCFNTVGNQLVTGSFDHTVAIWDVASRRSGSYIVSCYCYCNAYVDLCMCVIIYTVQYIHTTYPFCIHVSHCYIFCFFSGVSTLWSVTQGKSAMFSLTGIAPS